MINGQVSTTGDNIEQLDLKLFFVSFYCTYLAAVEKSELATRVDSNEVPLIVRMTADNNSIEMSKSDSSAFAKECASDLMSAMATSDPIDPFVVKQIVENYKLKVKVVFYY